MVRYDAVIGGVVVVTLVVITVAIAVYQAIAKGVIIDLLASLIGIKSVF
jgi:hypothetical protein